MQSLRERILARGADPDEIASWLDGLDPKQRVAETRELDPEAQRRLWTLCRGRAVRFDDLVPPDRGALETVRHYGRNTLPAFRLFEKRFCRPDAAAGPVLWGYNEGVTRRFVGPGYYVCRQTPGNPRGDVVIGYNLVPTTRPPGWPILLPNTVPPQRFVYGFMEDFLRRLSAHVSIGRAWRRDRETTNFFVLCRER
jgi:hypothetical protein